MTRSAPFTAASAVDGSAVAPLDGTAPPRPRPVARGRRSPRDGAAAQGRAARGREVERPRDAPRRRGPERRAARRGRRAPARAPRRRRTRGTAARRDRRDGRRRGDAPDRGGVAAGPRGPLRPRPRRRGRLAAVAACVCFPSRWSLAEKLGASLAAIHGPVPGFERELAAQAGPSSTGSRRRARCGGATGPCSTPPSCTSRRPRRDAWRADLAERRRRRVVAPCRAPDTAPAAREPPARSSSRSARTCERSARPSAASPGLAAALAATLATVPATSPTYKGWTPACSRRSRVARASSAAGLPAGRPPATGTST